MTAAEMVQKVRDAVTVPQALAIADEFVLEVVHDTEDAVETTYGNNATERIELFKDLVRELHEAKHSGHPQLCPEPICRDAQKMIDSLGLR